MIHSGDVNILDKNYNLFGSVKVLRVNFFLTVFAVSTIKSFMRGDLGVMPVNIIQWRIETGIFHTRFAKVSKSRSALLLYDYCTIAFSFVCCMAITLFICSDMEINSGPKNTKSCYFSLSHWNINSLPAHDFSKLSKHTIQNTILICLSETYLDSSCADDDHGLT